MAVGSWGTRTREWLRWRRPAAIANDRHVPSSERAPSNQQTRSCLTAVTVFSWAPDTLLTPRQTGRLTVGSNVTLTLTCGVELVSLLVSELKDCCGSVLVSYCYEKLVPETGELSGTERKGNIHRWTALPEDWWRHRRLRRLKCVLWTTELCELVKRISLLVLTDL
jgi:hypothetical protein